MDRPHRTLGRRTLIHEGGKIVRTDHFFCRLPHGENIQLARHMNRLTAQKNRTDGSRDHRIAIGLPPAVIARVKVSLDDHYLLHRDGLGERRIPRQGHAIDRNRRLGQKG